MPVTTTLKLEGPDLTAFCRRWRVQELAVFGSALRDDFRPRQRRRSAGDVRAGCRAGVCSIRPPWRASSARCSTGGGPRQAACDRAQRRLDPATGHPRICGDRPCGAIDADPARTSCVRLAWLPPSASRAARPRRAAKRLSAPFREANPDVPWIGHRRHASIDCVHGYDGVDLDRRLEDGGRGPVRHSSRRLAALAPGRNSWRGSMRQVPCRFLAGWRSDPASGCVQLAPGRVLPGDARVPVGRRPARSGRTPR